MKKLLLFSIIPMAAAMIVACYKENNQLSASPSVIAIPAAGGYKYVRITSSSDWSLSIPTTCDWLRTDFGQESGKATDERGVDIMFTIDPNYGAARKVTVLLSNTKAFASIIFEQQAYVSAEGNLIAPATVNTLSTTATFVPFSDNAAYKHSLVYAGGSLDGQEESQGNAEDKTFEIEVNNWGTYTFQYIAWVDSDGNGVRNAGDVVKEGGKCTIKFEMAATGATLELVRVTGEYPRLKITNLEQGAKEYVFYKDGQMLVGIYQAVDGKESIEQVIGETGKYYVKAVFKGHSNDPGTVYGPSSNEVTAVAADFPPKAN